MTIHELIEKLGTIGKIHGDHLPVFIGNIEVREDVECNRCHAAQEERFTALSIELQDVKVGVYPSQQLRRGVCLS